MEVVCTDGGSKTLQQKVENAVHTAMLEDRTIGGQNYRPFMNLNGVRDSGEFIENAKRLLVMYVDLLVFQDEWRRFSPLGNRGPDTSYEPAPFVNYFAIRRDFVILNMAARKLIKMFPAVQHEYTSCSDQGWKEDLLGAMVYVALVAKARVNGVPKIKPAQEAGVVPDIPWEVHSRAAAQYYMQSCVGKGASSLPCDEDMDSLACAILSRIISRETSFAP
jgi:hypothetical protein